MGEAELFPHDPVGATSVRAVTVTVEMVVVVVAGLSARSTAVRGAVSLDVAVRVPSSPDAGSTCGSTSSYRAMLAPAQPVLISWLMTGRVNAFQFWSELFVAPTNSTNRYPGVAVVLTCAEMELAPRPVLGRALTPSMLSTPL